jgi:hypothetical protein
VTILKASEGKSKMLLSRAITEGKHWHQSVNQSIYLGQTWKKEVDDSQGARGQIVDQRAM